MAVLFEDTIKNLRQNKKMTQAELAMKLRVTRAMISAYENGTRQPSHETLQRMAHVFNVSMDFLYDHKNGQCARQFLDVTGIEKKHRLLLEELAEALRGEGNA
ncbi:MAG: helix-turn-helix domain-containing protein [Clostridia bacterium]|nr:helix-turn-helix domain-containing protein [Clostridia bacterium]